MCACNESINPYLIQDKPTELPFVTISRSFMQVASSRMITVSPFGQHDQLVVVDADGALHFRAQHLWTEVA